MMDKTKNNKDYILTKIKYQNFYILYNGIDEEKGKQLKQIAYETWNKKEINDDYESLIHKELVYVCYDLLKKQLKLIYDYLYLNSENLYFDNETDLNKIYMRLPKNIISLIEKNAHGIEYNLTLKDVIQEDNIRNMKLYQIMGYNDSLKEILEMFFETEKYEEMREKFLKRDEGKEEAILLEQVKLKMFD